MKSSFKKAADLVQGVGDKLLGTTPYQRVTVQYEGQEFTLDGYRDDHITNHMLRDHEFYELELLEFIKERCEPDGTFVDVGANIGTHTVFFSRVCGADRVISVEPSRETFGLLGRNVGLNGCLETTLIHAALGEEAGYCRLVRRDEANRGMDSVERASEGEIRMLSLDEIAPREPKLIKIDTEGFEMEVLRGASAVLEEWSPLVIVEAATDQEFSEVSEYLEGFGYQFVETFNHTPTHVFEKP